MGRPGVASRSARSSEQHIDRKLEKAYQDYSAIRDVLEEMQVGEAVLGPRVEEPKRRSGRAGPWRNKTLAELEDEIGVMSRLRAAVLFGWNSRENTMQQIRPQQQHPHQTATRPDHPSLSTPPPSTSTTPTSTLETDDAAAAASLHIVQQLGRHRQYHDQQEQHGYPLADVQSHPEGAGPAVATTTVPHDFGNHSTQYQQQQQQHGGAPHLSGGHPMPIDDVHQPSADTSSSGNVDQALPTPMAYQQPDMRMVVGLGDGTQQYTGDGLNWELWDLSNSREQEPAGHDSEEDLLRWAGMLGWEELLSMDWSIAPEEGLEKSQEAV